MLHGRGVARDISQHELCTQQALNSTQHTQQLNKTQQTQTNTTRLTDGARCSTSGGDSSHGLVAQAPETVLRAFGAPSVEGGRYG